MVKSTDDCMLTFSHDFSLHKVGLLYHRTFTFTASSWLLDLLTPHVNTTALHHASKQTGFEPTIPAGERPQTYALDREATGSDIQTGYGEQFYLPSNTLYTLSNNAFKKIVKHIFDDLHLTLQPSVRLLNQFSQFYTNLYCNKYCKLMGSHRVNTTALYIT